RRSLPVPVFALWPFALLLATGLVAEALGVAPHWATRPLVVAGFHGGLLAGALAAAWGGARGWGGPATLLTGFLLGAGVSYQLSPWGSLAYLVPPLIVAGLGWRHAHLRRLSWDRPEDLRALLLGALIGLFLGAHLLFSASRTFGYPVRLTPAAPLLAAFAYDVGANVLSAELFIRGTLFNAWLRRWGFSAGATCATGVFVLRYLADPSLPRTLEVTAGAVFYLALLSVAGCALTARSGSLLPSAVASLCFFGAYRALQLW
ncbi:MAG: hypothetical protein ACE5FK_09590, partial [Candidatus Methylomirabilia bacterium]